MLVRFTDVKGQQVWVNPIHVKMVQEKKKSTEIVFIVSTSFSVVGAIRVEEPVDEVAARISEAMPAVMAFVPDDDSGDDSSGAAAAVMAG